ncbi:MAG TPA: NAD(P)H-hydrate dehydratase [Pirellulales bacterium]|jgi:NAD(P)H-hydrate epimerase|nr:NAD(P)H-hydrate dehydratase [Pirellulales bacterium]
MAESETALPKLPRRSADSYKNKFGHALLIGGSAGFAGSISLSGMAALRCGAGLVTVATPRACQAVVAGFEPSYMTLPLPDAEGQVSADARETLVSAAQKASVLAYGPGLGRSAELTELIVWLYQTLDTPAVVDADALNALAERQDALCRPGGPRILTPHPGEFARLAKIDRVPDDQRQPLAMDLARRTGAVVLLKGHRTVITDGKQLALNTTGNPGMASGGSGDVLTGVITALVCQHLSPFDATRLGAHVHGLAGDLAAAAIGPVGIIASDLVRCLPQALATCLS